MVFEENSLRLTVPISFQKQKKKISSYFLELISYNNVVVTIQIYFSSTFYKLWVHIADNIADVVRGPEYCRKW